MNSNKRFFVSKENLSVASATVTGEEFLHLKNVMRAKIGDEAILFSGDGFEHNAKLIEIGKDAATFKIISSTKKEESKTKIALFQATVKGDALDRIVRQATEIGANEIVLFSSERTEVKLSADKLSRFEKIIISSCKQCERTSIPTVKIETLKNSIKELKNFDLVIFANENENTKSLKLLSNSIENAKNIAVLIGPEGGFSQTESKQIEEAGAKSVSLGKNILRADTASIATLSYIKLAGK